MATSAPSPGASGDTGGISASVTRAEYRPAFRFGSDPEWLIGGGRLITAVFALIAIYIDPTKPAAYFHDARIIIVVYILFSLIAVLIPVNRPIESKVHIFPHIVDIGVAACLAYLTNELTSPFFVFLPFTLLAATIRWGLVGSISSGVVLEIVMIVIGWSDLRDGHPEINIVIMRSTYFVVSAMLLGYLGAYRKRSRQRFAELAAWTVATPDLTFQQLISSLLGRASRLLDAPSVILFWQDKEEADGTLAVWHLGEFRHPERLSESEWRALAIDSLATNAESHRDPKDLAGHALYQVIGAADHRCSANFAGARFEGCLLVLNADYEHEEVEPLTSIIATRIGNELERIALLNEVADSARVQERTRLARDLHDSVLQDLAAVRLKLRSTAAQAPETMRETLDEIGTLLGEQQSRIRQFVEQTRTTARPLSNTLAAELNDTLGELRRAWDCDIRITVDPPTLLLSSDLKDEVSQIVSEATSNAVRHGGATRIDLAVAQHEGQLQLAISDNGSGSSTDSEGAARSPLSLSSRVGDLAGRLSVTRRKPGFALMIELPMP